MCARVCVLARVCVRVFVWNIYKAVHSCASHIKLQSYGSENMNLHQWNLDSDNENGKLDSASRDEVLEMD
jgi:hypothetical protein